MTCLGGTLLKSIAAAAPKANYSKPALLMGYAGRRCLEKCPNDIARGQAFLDYLDDADAAGGRGSTHHCRL